MLANLRCDCCLDRMRRSPMISYWTSVGNDLNSGEFTSKSSGRILSMNVLSSSSVAIRGSGLLALPPLASELTLTAPLGPDDEEIGPGKSGNRYGSWFLN